MHELSLAGALLDKVLEHARGRRVLLVRLTLGRLRQVTAESLELYFGFLAHGTVCEGAQIVARMVQARLACDACDEEWKLELPLFCCPECSSTKVNVIAGTEFRVESIEVEDEEDACIA